MLLILPYSLEAAPPSPFTAVYEARYGGFKANAERSLQIGENGQVEMNTMLRLKMLGKTLSTIKEKSILTADALSGELKPEAYSFVQSGIGKRSRHIAFDWDAGQARADIGNDLYEIPLEFPVADNLSAYLEVRNQLLAGEVEIIFPAIDKGKLEEYHFRVLAEEEVSTSLGLFRTVKIERVREPESKRSTNYVACPGLGLFVGQAGTTGTKCTRDRAGTETSRSDGQFSNWQEPEGTRVYFRIIGRVYFTVKAL
jgi:hypothetical protein